MKKLLFPLFMLAMIVTSCEKDPDMNKLDSDYSVYTDYVNPEKPDVPLNKNDAFQKVQKRRVQEKR